MTNYKYSKSSKFYLSTKKDFFCENDKLLNKLLQSILDKNHFCSEIHCVVSKV